MGHERNEGDARGDIFCGKHQWDMSATKGRYWLQSFF